MTSVKEPFKSRCVMLDRCSVSVWKDCKEIVEASHSQTSERSLWPVTHSEDCVTSPNSVVYVGTSQGAEELDPNSS